VPPTPPVQRWRILVASTTDAPVWDARELVAAWVRGLTEHGVPLAWSGGGTPRARIAFGAALPAGMVALGELIDISLVERWQIWRMREAVQAAMPMGWRLLDLSDVWVAAPALPAAVVAADYTISLRQSDAPLGAYPAAPPDGEPDAHAGRDDRAPDPVAIADACQALLDASTVRRVRPKGGSTVTYDLRPLLIDVRLSDPRPSDPRLSERSRPALAISARTRFHPELGTGRPEEVVAALADVLGVPLAVDTLVRERLILADDLDAGG
jgi:hypothetical protein